MKNSFVVYNDFLTILKEISNDEAGLLFKAMIHYSATKEMLPVPKSLKLIFISIRQTIDRDTKKWEEQSLARAEYGRRGGIASAQAKASISKLKLASASKSTVTVNVTDSVTEIDNQKTHKTLHNIDWMGLANKASDLAVKGDLQRKQPWKQ